MFETVAFAFFGIIVFLVLLWFIIQGPYLYGLRKIPGPPPLPIIGNIHQISSESTKFLPTLLDLKEKYGGVYKLFIGYNERQIVVSDPKLLESILNSTKELHKSRVYKFLEPWLGLGLLTSPPLKWKKHRKIITPAFHFKILENFLEVFQKNDEIFLKKLEKELHGYPFDVYEYVSLLALDNIVETAMNTEINAQDGGHKLYVDNTRQMGQIVVERQFHPIESIDFLYKFTDTYSKQTEYLKVLHGLTERVIKERRESILNDSNQNALEDKETGTKNKIAFLDLLLRSTVDGRPLTDYELRSEVDTFLFEGHDTTASGISFCLYCISKHPDVQQKIIEEIESVLHTRDPEKRLTISDLQAMTYLEAVIKESLRLYPSATFIQRCINHNLTYDGITLPTGTTVTIFIYGVMHDSKYFPDPYKFDPDRFLGHSDFPMFAFIPFSAGPRNCIGQKYAMLEMKSTIVNCLRHYELLEVPNDELVLSVDAILKSQNGIKIRIQKRKY